ncbi:hypothetical protein Aperf_G00000026748 [Anoplocephala perfoliata]
MKSVKKSYTANVKDSKPDAGSSSTFDPDVPIEQLKNKKGIQSGSFSDNFLAYCEAEENFRDSSHESEGEAKAGVPSTSRQEQRERRKLEKERLVRTVFVGNLPAWITKEILKKLFKSALRNSEIDLTKCNVESVRIRGAVPTTGGTSNQARKRSSIQHEFAAGDKHTLIGFVVLTSKVGIPAILKLNGHFLTPKNGSSDLGRHIRVDVCCRQKYNNRNSVFIGNLPFSTNEEEVRSLFLPFGAIKGVRLIRDKSTGAVKGIGFVEFEDQTSVQLVVRQSAASLRGSDALSIGGRQIRVEAWKSIKKAKEVKGQPLRRRPSNQQKTSAADVRIPTNLRGEIARKVFVKRALQKRNKRKENAQSAITEGGVKKSKFRKKGIKKAKREKANKPRHKNSV